MILMATERATTNEKTTFIFANSFYFLCRRVGCSYKSTEGPASDTTTFIRDGNQFVTDGILGPFSIVK